MISIEAWRAVIGSFVGGKGRPDLIGRNHSVTSFGESSFSLILTLISTNLVLVLLMIGGIESNPGPNSEGNSAECIMLAKAIIV